VKIAKIDATVNRQMAQKFKIKGFPTILFFGTDDKSTPVAYES
jgi:thiol-disulfide isomerase/thioredoxin